MPRDEVGIYLRILKEVIFVNLLFQRKTNLYNSSCKLPKSRVHDL